ncbi:uncharacterized protein TNCV_278121 [Trichonephila clavipes]|nr:uncharacterized protein TNCV_278121 [Trichonephila clavipes]
MKTRLRTPSTDQSSRISPHRKKCTSTVTCFICRRPSIDSTFTRDSCVFSNQTKAPGCRTFGIVMTITRVALDTHPSTPSFGVVPHTRKLDCSGIEPGRL